MADYGHDLRFGVFLTPLAEHPQTLLETATVAEQEGLDLVTCQDHPYQSRFLDTWTLLSVIAARTERVRVAPNVADLPLRTPVMLARAVASLDILSGGRIELGIGAGAFWDAIAAMGGPRRTPGEAVDALAEALPIIRATWAAGGRGLRFDGDHYKIAGARPGPAPVHDIEIWVGGYKPRMLALTGAQADGWLPSLGYIDIEDIPAANARIDAAAEEAGRSPRDVRRMLNIGGTFGSSEQLKGPPAGWADLLADLTLREGISTYLMAVDGPEETRRFAAEVAPAVREQVAAARGG